MKCQNLLSGKKSYFIFSQHSKFLNQRWTVQIDEAAYLCINRLRTNERISHQP